MMPHIIQKERPGLDYIVRQMEVEITHPGKLAYLLHKYGLTIKPSFLNFCTFFGALVLFMLYFFRRVVLPYEAKKRKENGDVY